MPRQFFAMIRVELLKVFTRGSGLGALAVAVGLGLLVALAMKQVSGMQDQMSFNGQSVRGIVTFDMVQVGRWALWARNFFVLPLLLLLATAGTLAGEHADRTLRELVVRPVPRWSILLAKAVALSILSAITIVLTAVCSLALGYFVLGGPTVDQAIATGGDSLSRLALGFAASWLSDLALIAIGLALSTFVRSVGGVVVSIVLLLMLDRALWLVLKAAGLLGLEVAKTLVQWTLVNAMGCWEGWESNFLPMQFAIVGAIIVAASTIATVRFSRVDVP